MGCGGLTGGPLPSGDAAAGGQLCAHPAPVDVHFIPGELPADWTGRLYVTSTAQPRRKALHANDCACASLTHPCTLHAAQHHHVDALSGSQTSHLTHQDLIIALHSGCLLSLHTPSLAGVVCCRRSLQGCSPCTRPTTSASPAAASLHWHATTTRCRRRTCSRLC